MLYKSSLLASLKFRSCKFSVKGLVSVEIVQTSLMLLFIGNFTDFYQHAMKKALQRFHFLRNGKLFEFEAFAEMERHRFAMAPPH